MTRRLGLRRRVAAPIAAVAVALGLTLGLSACGAAGDDTTTQLHASVVEVAERAAAGDYAGALAELALLDRDLTAAVDAGRLDADREQRIRAAMDQVRADLETAAVTPTATPTPEPAPDAGTGDGDAPGNSGDAPGNSGNNGNNGNNGNGNGKGKGKD